ncbi:hypothetical protein ACFWN5_32185 [Streptomyces sp. NPDC058430]|uniref:hypothetical protein n=1 Tax=Streptomyces sp. NPDC058430 TaxID=3346495 RepID=UPI00365D6352
MTPRLRTTTSRPLPLPPMLWPLLCLALLSGPATTGSYAYAAEPSPTRAPASADDEAQAGSRPGEGRTPPGRAESKSPDHDRPEESPPTHRPSHAPSAAGPSAPATKKPSASASASASATPKRPSASRAHPKAASADPSRKGQSVRKSHSTSASTSTSVSVSASEDADTETERSHTPSPDPSLTRSAHAAIPVPPEDPQSWEEDPDEQQVQPPVRPTGIPADNADRTPRQTVAAPVIPGVGILPLGSGLVLVGLGVGFLALRLRRT